MIFLMQKIVYYSDFSNEDVEPALWRKIMRQNFTHWERLADFLELDNLQREKILKKSKFSLNVPLRLAQKVVKRTLDDPILRQFLPLIEETHSIEGFIKDPVGDCQAQKSPKLLQKYAGRALLVSTSACAMHCRYCFRQNFTYQVGESGFEKEIEIISQDKTIREVILSGGDPLSLSDTVLSALLNKISSFSHVRHIRFHTRFPIGIPERIDTSFLNMLASVPCQIWFVIHCNHPRELDQEVLARLNEIQKMGISVLNQAVLLHQVNDDVETLFQLYSQLIDHGILPYYLHQLDRVQGTAHFEVSEEKGKWLMTELAKLLPGYAVPKYVREVTGEKSKVILT